MTFTNREGNWEKIQSYVSKQVKQSVYHNNIMTNNDYDYKLYVYTIPFHNIINISV